MRAEAEVGEGRGRGRKEDEEREEEMKKIWVFPLSPTHPSIHIPHSRTHSPPSHTHNTHVFAGRALPGALLQGPGRGPVRGPER
jgi:hypothetical protein